MGSGKRLASSGKAADVNPSMTGSQRRTSLPPKPTCQKRSRNAAGSITDCTATSAHAIRARVYRPWGRRSASWSPNEDARLVELVNKESASPPSITASKTWSRVAAQLTNRTGKQCRERYLNQLKPGIRRDPWSPEEERVLREAHEKFGNKWVTIASELPGRTDNCVKNHWNSMLRKRQRREAALKAAQAEVVATLGSAHGLQSTREMERRRLLGGVSEGTVRTGYLTPSGTSSSQGDFATSGVPSPYAGCSPLTPVRDSKLQISTLVASSSKELPVWGAAGDELHVMRNGCDYGKGTGVYGAFDHHVLMTRGSIQGSSRRLSSINKSIGECSPSAKNLEKGRDNAAPSTDGPHESILKNASPMECVASTSVIPSLSHGVHSLGNSAVGCEGRHLRRSSRLSSSVTIRNIARLGSIGALEHHKTELSNARSNEQGASSGHALAALAAAASTIPPSPLTPDSRFSNSKSRSESPDLHLKSGSSDHDVPSRYTDNRRSQRLIMSGAKKSSQLRLMDRAA